MFITFAGLVQAQEFTTSLMQNTILKNSNFIKTKKSRALSLPFIDDFSYKGPFPKSSLWLDNKVFVNNTLAQNPVSMGVATFDMLNEFGISYHTNGLPTQYYADSLTSVAIDLGGLTTTDFVYLSFYVQPQGNGFKPESADSLLLFFNDNTGNWIKVWSQAGSAVTPFTQVMLPISNPIFLHNNFQFRFINIASPNSNDDVWNIDYVKLDKNRSIYDTILNDVAFTNVPTGILANYTSMPYRQFYNFQGAELAPDFFASIQNNTTNNVTLGVNLIAKDLISNTGIASDNTAVNLAINGTSDASYNIYNVTYSPIQYKAPVTIRNTFFYGQTAGTVNTLNDTINQDNIFSNYFAYDDGTCEKAYYLYATPNFDASAAIQFHVNIADTLQGLAIKFAQQVPIATNKKFDIVLYKNLNTSTQTQLVLNKDTSHIVQYESTINGFSNYAFAQPLHLDSGTYYIGITQVANTNSDTIYFGLDVNTIKNPQYAYYNVDGVWNKSGVQGSVMMRPIVGDAFTPTAIKSVKEKVVFNIYPNPSSDFININCAENFSEIAILNSCGVAILTEKKLNQINIKNLPTGIYSNSKICKTIIIELYK
jgi:hypothetical protein